ncbi:MAG TPA: hypothetical protein VES20_19495 [Bryobacteraceae bacterium]|nr:hypothetical protein [Bryobacteraceae bacterium]
MKTTLFEYETNIGKFWIRPEPAGRVQLGLDRHKLRTYGSPTAAARAVAERDTGWPAWDTDLELIAPPSLRRWKRPPQRTPRKLTTL